MSLPRRQQIVWHLPFPSHLALSLKSGEDDRIDVREPHNIMYVPSTLKICVYHKNNCLVSTWKNYKNNKRIPEVTDLVGQLLMMQTAVAANFE